MDKSYEEATGNDAPVFDKRGRKGQVIKKKDDSGGAKSARPDKVKTSQKNMSRKQRRDIKFGGDDAIANSTGAETINQKSGKAQTRVLPGEHIIILQPYLTTTP